MRIESSPASRSVVPATSSTDAAPVEGMLQSPREQARPRDTASADAVTKS